MSLLPRPSGLPRRIPAWAWKALKLPGAHLPHRKPAWFWIWRKWRLTGKLPALTRRQKIVRWAHWAVAHSSEWRYSEAADRAEWLARPRLALPKTTDCSGFVTFCYWAADQDDPNGLSYKTLGYTGTLIDHAQKVGTVTEDIPAARKGDPVVIGPGTGAHVVLVVEPGMDPLVASHGRPGVELIRLSADPRTPKRVCKTLR